MSRKCGISLITYLLFALVALIAMHAFLYLPVNQWVGVGIGGGMLVVSFAVCMIFRERRGVKFRRAQRFIRPAAYLFNALASGIAMSSLYVYLGDTLLLWQSAAVWGASVVLFLLCCLLTNLSFVQKFAFPCMLFWCVLILAGVIVGMCLCSIVVFSLALLLFVLYAMFFATISIGAADFKEHEKNLLYASFGALLVIIIVVLLVISEGEAADGLDAPPSGTLWRKNYNPYVFRQ